MSLEERTAPGLHDHLIDVVLPALQIKGRRILDVGAGAGALAARLASQGFDVTGVEREVERFGADTPIIRADLDDPSWSDHVPGRFSLILAVEVIEHVENPIQFLRALSRLLDPKGLAVVTTPNMESFPSRAKFLLQGRLRLMDMHGDPTHISPIFGDLLVRQYLPKANLQLVAQDFYPRQGFVTGRSVYSWLLQLMPGWAMKGSLRGDIRIVVLRGVP